MRVIHIDRVKSLQIGCVAYLKTDFNEYPLNIRSYIETYFPKGLSFFGERYIIDIVKISQGDTAFLNNEGQNFDALIEHDFEIVRREKYPYMPSRLQSAFACDNIDSIFKYWPKLLHADMNIFELDCWDAYKLDASFLKAYSCKTSYKLTSTTPGYNNICKYWEGRLSNSPCPEMLVPLPFYVTHSKVQCNL